MGEAGRGKGQPGGGELTTRRGVVMGLEEEPSFSERRSISWLASSMPCAWSCLKAVTSCNKMDARREFLADSSKDCEAMRSLYWVRVKRRRRGRTQTVPEDRYRKGQLSNEDTPLRYNCLFYFISIDGAVIISSSL